MTDPLAPRRVMVELSVPVGTRLQNFQEIRAAVHTTGLDIDVTYAAVPVPALPAMREVLLRTGREAVILRGRLPAAAFESLAAHPDVIQIWHDEPVPQHALSLAQSRAPCPIPPCDCTGSTIAQGTLADVVLQLGVDKVWSLGNRGTGVVIGVVDCGICALGRNIASGETAKIPNVIGGYPNDSWGTTSRKSAYWFDHGNMIATDILGIAPEGSLYDIRITDGFAGHESVLLSNAIAGLDWAIERRRTDGTPHILSNSWGLHKPLDEPSYARDPNHCLTRKYIQAIEEGMIVLFSAGNCGGTCPSSYCGATFGSGQDIWGANGHPRSITVGAVNILGQLLGSSSTGPSSLDPTGVKPDFCSITQFAGYYPNSASNVACDGGTSAATAIASGVVALLKQRRPSLTQDQVKSLLQRTANPIGPKPTNQFTGAGVILAKSAWDALP